MARVLVTEAIAEGGLDRLRDVGHDVDVQLGLSPEELRSAIVGAHALAPAAGELIHELALAIQFGAKLNELSDLVHVYPTLASGIGRIAADRSFATGRKYRALTKISRWMG